MLGKKLRGGRHHRWPMFVARVTLILALVLMAAPATLASTEPAPPQPVPGSTDQVTAAAKPDKPKHPKKSSEPRLLSRPVCRRNRNAQS